MNTDKNQKTQLPQMAVMRSFYFRNTNFIKLSICLLGLIYVNLGLPFRIKRIDYSSTFLEVMY